MKTDRIKKENFEKVMSKKRIVKLDKFKMTYHGNFNDGFVLKRSLSIGECKHILRDLLGIVLQTRKDFCDNEEYVDFNEDLIRNVNNWLRGESGDNSIMEYAYGCENDQIGIWNAFKIAEYLQYKKIL